MTKKEEFNLAVFDQQGLLGRRLPWLVRTVEGDGLCSQH